MKRQLIVGPAFVCIALALTQVLANTAAEIFSATGIDAGFCVHIGCGKGELTADLANGGKMLVHGLSTNRNDVADARAHIQNRSLYGGAMAAHHASFNQLPYNTNIVDLVVADFDKLGNTAPSMLEVQRVLRPQGVAYVKSGGSWKKTVKPENSKMDEWTHFFYDASGNPHGKDSIAGPMQGVQWHIPYENIESQLYGGATALSTGKVGNKYRIHARNAFNGLLRWNHTEKLSLNPSRGCKSNTSVCVDDKAVYGPLIDTGYTRKINLKTGEITVLSEGVKVEQKGRCAQFVVHSAPILLRYEKLLVQAHKNEVIALNPETGKRMWIYSNPGTQTALLVSAGGGKIFVGYSSSDEFQGLHYGAKVAKIIEIVGLNASNGERAWTKTDIDTSHYIYNLVYHKNDLYFGSLAMNSHRNSMTYKKFYRVNINTGQNITSREPSVEELPAKDGQTALRIWNDRLLINSPKRIKSFSLDFADGIDLYTADTKGYGHCAAFRGSAFGQNAGQQGFLDYRDGVWHESHISRSRCDNATVPAYGLMFPYDPMCACWPKLFGHVAIRCLEESWASEVSENDRLEKGAAISAPEIPKQWPETDEWPMFLHDDTRNNFSASELGKQFGVLFHVKIPGHFSKGPVGYDQSHNTNILGHISPPTVAEDKLFIAATDQNQIYAFDAHKEGDPLWTFTAGGRIDGPPTIYRGLCLFGCRDGYVYALRASDGEMVWRFFAAPQRRNIVVCGQVENVWPVVGSVLLFKEKLYATAGRMSDADNGIYIYKLDPVTGTKEAKQRIHDDYNWSYDDSYKASYGYFGRNTAQINDILVANTKRELIFLQNIAIDPNTLAWTHMYNFPKGKKLFPSVPAYTYTIETPGLLSYQHVCNRNIISKGAQAWMHCANTSQRAISAFKERRKIVANLPLMRDGDNLYAKAGGHLNSHVLRYKLDENGEPANFMTVKNMEAAVADTVLPNRIDDDKIVGNFHMEDFGHMTGGGDVLVAVGYTEGKVGNNFKAFSMSSNTRLCENQIPAPADNYGIAVAYKNVYVSLQDGTVIVYSSEGKGGDITHIKHRPAAVSSRYYNRPAESSDTLQPAAQSASDNSDVSAVTQSEAPVSYRRHKPNAKSEASSEPAAEQLKNDIVKPAGFGTFSARAMTDVASLQKEPESSPLVVSEKNEKAGQSGVFQELWVGILADYVDDLLEAENYPHKPAKVELVKGLQTTVRHMDNYGIRLRALLIPQATGTYRFMINTAHAAELSIAPQGHAEELRVVAANGPDEESDETLTMSDSISLHKDSTYLVELLFTKTTGDDLCYVQWERPDGQKENVPEKLLIPYREEDE